MTRLVVRGICRATSRRTLASGVVPWRIGGCNLVRLWGWTYSYGSENFQIRMHKKRKQRHAMNQHADFDGVPIGDLFFNRRSATPSVTATNFWHGGRSWGCFWRQRHPRFPWRVIQSRDSSLEVHHETAPAKSQGISKLVAWFERPAWGAIVNSFWHCLHG